MKLTKLTLIVVGALIYLGCSDKTSGSKDAGADSGDASNDGLPSQTSSDSQASGTEGQGTSSDDAGAMSSDSETGLPTHETDTVRDDEASTTDSRSESTTADGSDTFVEATTTDSTSLPSVETDPNTNSDSTDNTLADGGVDGGPSTKTGSDTLPEESDTSTDTAVTCTPTSCGDNALCNETSGECECESGFELAGDHCTEIDECASVTCADNATCIDGVNTYSCSCDSGYESTDPETTACTNINDCQGVTCADNASCVDGLNDYSCVCNSGYESTNPETIACININDCQGVTCADNASCVDGLNDYSCVCDSGYESTNPETIACTNINDCQDVDCATNAKCYDGLNDYSCICDSGYESTDPETIDCENINDCHDVDCAANAKCYDGLNDYSCVCDSGYESTDPETIDCENIDDCEGVACSANASCEDGINSYECICIEGYSSPDPETVDCETINECAQDQLNDCAPLSNCIDEDPGYRCECPDGYVGDGVVGDTHTGCTVKNVILIVADGLGFEQFEATRIYATTDINTPLEMETDGDAAAVYPGEVITTSLTGITDSAAAATAMATGNKVLNETISMNRSTGEHWETALEFHKSLDKRVGTVTTHTDMLDATPSGFHSHARDRDNRATIATNMLAGSRPNVIMGRPDPNNAFTQQSATNNGYEVVTTNAQLEAFISDLDSYEQTAASTGNPLLLAGFFSQANEVSPNLTARTVAALDIVDNDDDGFFLLIEHEGTDEAGHSNNIQGVIDSAIEVNDAVNYIINTWMPNRFTTNGFNDTLVILLADHETGGFTLNEANYTPTTAHTTYPNCATNECSFSSLNHTGVNVPIYAWGVSAQYIGGAMDNTELYDFLRGDYSE